MTEVKALLLAAGRGLRLKPLTDHWPKCLMPIHGRPILEYWLCTLYENNIKRVFVNTFHQQDAVLEFLERDRFRNWVTPLIERRLLGTAGTLRVNRRLFSDGVTLLVHADNWSHSDFNQFLRFHRDLRPKGTVMTMMTFRTRSPESCGIVELDGQGIVQNFYEKVVNPPDNLANGAVYLLEPEVLEWITTHGGLSDFSTEVLPHFLGRIATWENTDIHSDIGALSELICAQSDPVQDSCWPEIDEWQTIFERNPIHEELKQCSLQEYFNEN